jgi:hypothetical protein
MKRVYKSDLAISAEDVVAKCGAEEVELKTTVVSGYPETYSWGTTKLVLGDDTKLDAELEDLDNETYNYEFEDALDSDDFLVAAEYNKTTGKLEIAEHNHYVCTVTDGVVLRKATIKLTEDIAFVVTGNDGKALVETTSPA